MPIGTPRHPTPLHPAPSNPRWALGENLANYIDDFDTDTDERDFAGIGAACGVAAAFHAPIAATILVIEEISSFYQKSFATHVLVAAVFAYHMERKKYFPNMAPTSAG